MIENLRGRSTETKYGRIPLWLYETGVGLQAIATYGWLHGRYGHYERVMPSYATLAKELGVSRGSVIAYVKALVSVGAVRVEGSRQAGRTVNEYVIAFNAPFAVVRGGQNTDQVVSGLTSTGQHADGGGQRAVPEEDVSTKTFVEDKDLSLPHVPEQRTAATAAAPASEERETTAPQDKLSTAQKLVRQAAVVTADEEQPFITWATATHQPRGGAWWRTVAANGDLPDLVAAWRAERAPAATTTATPGGRPMPPWCKDPDCSEIDRMRDVETPEGDRLVVRCKQCHPDVAPTWGKPNRWSGHTPYQCPTDQSVYDLGFDGQPISTADKRAGAAFELAARLEAEEGRPLPGTDTTVAGWAAVARQLDTDRPR